MKLLLLKLLILIKQNILKDKLTFCIHFFFPILGGLVWVFNFLLLNIKIIIRPMEIDRFFQQQ